jgi:imidazolonepropionase-like amidohydrolase
VSDLLITVGRLLRGPAGELTHNAAVLVRDGMIAAAGPRADVTPPEGVPHLDFPDSTLLPGLVNGHAHLAMDGGTDPVTHLVAATPADLADGMALHARQLLDCGVTTVRDLGDREGMSVAARDAVDAGETPGPRIIPAITPLTPPGGHCHFFGGEVAGEAGIRALVRRNAERGAGVVKVMASGGHITPGAAPMWASQFTEGELAAAVAEAGAHGLPVAAHAHGVESIERCVAAGVRTIEHCTWLTGPDQPEWRDGAALAARMAAAGIAACCTVGPDDWRRMTDDVGEEAAKEVYGRIPWLHEQGVTLLPGTDGGVVNARWDDFAGALELYEWLGIPAATVLELTTSSAADVLGLGAVTGRVEPGLAADLLVVDGEPDARLSALRAVRLVVARGRVRDPAVPEDGSAVLARFTS